MEHLKETGHAIATQDEIVSKQAATMKKKKKNKVGIKGL